MIIQITNPNIQYVIVDDSKIEIGDVVCEKLLDNSYKLFTIHTLNDIDYKTQKKVIKIMNKPIKQTVYSPVINEEIFSLTASKDFWTYHYGVKRDLIKVLENNKQEGYFFTPEQLNEYTQSVIKQALENAAENAQIISQPYGDWCTECSEPKDKYISSESITNTFDETFKKFKV